MSARRLRLTFGPRAPRIIGAFWLVVGVASLASSSFEGRTYFATVGLLLGGGLLAFVRAPHAELDATSGVLTVCWPRLPLGTRTDVWPLADVVALETELAPDAIPGTFCKFDGWRSVWCLRSGERISMRAVEPTDTRARRRSRRVNDFLARARAVR